MPVPERRPSKRWHVQVYWAPDWKPAKKDWRLVEEQRANEGSQSQPDLYQVPAT